MYAFMFAVDLFLIDHMSQTFDFDVFSTYSSFWDSIIIRTLVRSEKKKRVSAELNYICFHVRHQSFFGNVFSDVLIPFYGDTSCDNC